MVHEREGDSCCYRCSGSREGRQGCWLLMHKMLRLVVLALYYAVTDPTMN